jgi:hypothetical protein
MDPGRRFEISPWLLLVVAGGVVGYHFLEGSPPLAALYMTVVIVSTVGFK